MLDHDNPTHHENAECTTICLACRMPWVYKMCVASHANGGLTGLKDVLQLRFDSHFTQILSQIA